MEPKKRRAVFQRGVSLCHLTWVAVGLFTLIPFAAQAEATHVLPPPRWQVSLSKQPLSYPEFLKCMPAGPALLFAPDRQIIALDRTTGRELWRRNNGIEKDIGVEGPGAIPTPQDLENGVVPVCRTYWQLIGVGSAEPVGPVALLRERQEHIVPDSSRPNKQRTTGERLEEVAIQAVTGQELWRRPLEHDYSFPNVVGNLLIDYQPDTRQAQNPKTLPLRYRDLATGMPLDRNTPQAQAAIQLAVQRQGKGPLLIQHYGTCYSLDLNAATATRIYSARSYLLSYAVFAPEGRMIFHNNPDDDGAGHSVWPRYVDGTDLKGKPIWMFPRSLQTWGIDDPKTIREPYSIVPMAPCRAAGSVLCVSGWKNDSPIWYGLDVRDGHVLWKRAMTSDDPKLLEMGRGCLFAAGPTLAWIDGRNGKVYELARIPPVATLFVLGDDLLVLDSQGNLIAYSLKAVLPATIRRLANGS